MYVHVDITYLLSIMKPSHEYYSVVSSSSLKLFYLSIPQLINTVTHNAILSEVEMKNSSFRLYHLRY